MLKFYTYDTYNGEAVAITLREMAIEHETIHVNLFAGEQKSPEFLALNPSGRIPVIVDQQADSSITVSQTGAILIYLAEKTGQFMPEAPQARAKVLEWLLFQLTDISANVFNNFLLESLVKPPQLEAAEILKARALSFYEVFDKQLQQHPYLTGDDVTIADFATFPVVHRLIESEGIKQLKNLMLWYQRMSQRPAIASVYQAAV